MRGGSSAQQPQSSIMPADGQDARLYDVAIRRALEMVNADGGAITTLDDSRRAMILRVRAVHPRFQPEQQRRRARPAAHPIEEAATTVLPATQLWRMYRPGERLVGYVWQTGKSVIMSDDEVRGLPGGTSPEEPSAAFHLAVPIFAAIPDTENTIGVTTGDPPVLGVLTVYVTDPQWPFMQNHIHLLEAQAQNIAQSLLLAHVVRQEQRHRRLISLLQELTGEVPLQNDIESFYEKFFERIFVAIGGVLDTEAFAVVLSQSNASVSRPLETPLSFYSVIESNQRHPSFKMREDQAPWWSWVRIGRAVYWITDEDRRALPQLRTRDWGSQRYMDSQLFVPMKTASGVVGALLVASPRTNAYTTEHVALLEMTGRFIALAIENAQVRRARQSGQAQQSESERALALLNNSLLGLNATLDVDLIIHDLVEQASELARGQICAYLEYNQATDELIINDIAQNKEHHHQEAIGQRIPIGQGRRRMALEGQPMALDDLTMDYGRGDIVATLLERYHVEAMLLVPVIYSESITRHIRVLGLMAIYAPDQNGLFAPSEEMNLMALGRVAASAIHNARTYAQLRELDRLKDEFILTASHEFRTPMSAIQGFSWLIQRRGATMTPEQGAHWAAEIIRATEQLKDMMDTITESWRTKSVQLPVPQPVEMAEVVRLALEISAPILASAEHETNCDIPADLWALGEQDRLRHVVSNLLTNAAKYSAPQSQITVTASVKSGAELLAMPRERGARDDDDDDHPVINVTLNSGPWVVISVQDQGMGISAINQKRLFAKFVRLELTTNVRGTGLGLYICRRYIEAMGGEIWVESAPSHGSTFSFCLPQIPTPAPNAPPPTKG